MIDTVSKGRIQRILRTLNKAAEICEIDIGTMMIELQREYAIQTRAATPTVNSDGLIEMRKTRPRPSEWSRAERLWAEGDTTKENIAAMLGVSSVAVHQHMRRRGVKKGSACRVVESVFEAADDGRAEVCNFLGI